MNYRAPSLSVNILGNLIEFEKRDLTGAEIVAAFHEQAPNFGAELTPNGFVALGEFGGKPLFLVPPFNFLPSVPRETVEEPKTEPDPDAERHEREDDSLLGGIAAAREEDALSEMRSEPEPDLSPGGGDFGGAGASASFETPDTSSGVESDVSDSMSDSIDTSSETNSDTGSDT